MLFGGVVHENIETAKFLHRFSDHLLADFFVANVAGQEKALAPFLFDLPLRFLRIFVFVQVTDGNVSAFFGEENCDGATNAAITARDESHLAAELSCPTIFAALSERTRSHPGFATRLTPLFLRRPDFSFLTGFRHKTLEATGRVRGK
jgi:hypothetical protein